MHHSPGESVSPVAVGWGACPPLCPPRPRLGSVRRSLPGPHDAYSGCLTTAVCRFCCAAGPLSLSPLMLLPGHQCRAGPSLITPPGKFLGRCVLVAFQPKTFPVIRRCFARCARRWDKTRTPSYSSVWGSVLGGAVLGVLLGCNGSFHPDRFTAVCSRAAPCHMAAAALRHSRHCHLLCHQRPPKRVCPTAAGTAPSSPPARGSRCCWSCFCLRCPSSDSRYR